MGQCVQAVAPAQQPHHAQAHVATADDQESSHPVILVEARSSAASRWQAAHDGSASEPEGHGMSFQVTIKPSNRDFTAEDGEAVLEAAMRNGITLPYGCRNGACGACKGKVLEGQVDYGQYAAHILPEFEKKHGFALFCQAKPLTDLVIEAREINAAGRDSDQEAALPGADASSGRPHDVAVLYLIAARQRAAAVPRRAVLEIILRDGKRRAYSMANAPGGRRAHRAARAQHGQRRVHRLRVQQDEGDATSCASRGRWARSSCARTATSRSSSWPAAPASRRSRASSSTRSTSA